MGLQTDVAFDGVGPLRTPGLDRLFPLATEIFLDRVAHQARLMRRFTFRLDAEPGLTVRRVANILHFARPAIPTWGGLQSQNEIGSREVRPAWSICSLQVSVISGTLRCRCCQQF